MKGTFSVSDDLDSYLDRVLIGGRERRDIVIEGYNPDWPKRFERERDRIAGALGPRCGRIDHVGSTAVPGLAAKPIIDIQLVVSDVDDEDSYLPALVAAGYVLRVRDLGHRMFRTPDFGVHVHLWKSEADVHRRILFRDWLRRSDEDRQRYENLKRQLAERQWEDMNYYAQAKGELIAKIMERAEAWARDERCG
jgi:GrpB-like predicted nucleotidyltransferase (UPF0157 family)